jgi:hypothetical protein
MASAWLVVVVTLSVVVDVLAPLPALAPLGEATCPPEFLAERPPTIATTTSAVTTSAPPPKITALLRPNPPWRAARPRRASLLTPRG